jgi:hypothetical protein
LHTQGKNKNERDSSDKAQTIIGLNFTQKILSWEPDDPLLSQLTGRNAWNQKGNFPVQKKKPEPA